MRLCCEMHHNIRLRNQLVDNIRVRNISVMKLKVSVRLQTRRYIVEVSGIGQSIQQKDFVVRIAFMDKIDEVTTTPTITVLDSNAKYVAFQTLYRPSEMVGIGSNPRFPWPYVEGLRLDEAINPLTMIATGMYGESLPNQNGAPLRLVVPWKYGFKSIKSIVKITLTDTQPETTWNKLAPKEYGFYSNVNPNVDHPRWSQARERVIGGSIFKLGTPLFNGSKRDTPLFNGYGKEVANLYSGMDLRKYY